MASLPRVVLAETQTDGIDPARELETQIRDLPERSLTYAKYLIPLYTSPNQSIRRSAFNASISSLNSQPQGTDQIVSAYESAIACPDSEVAKHALMYLPQFVCLSRDNAKKLISLAMKTTQTRPGFTDCARCIAEAMDAMKAVERPK